MTDKWTKKSGEIFPAFYMSEIYAILTKETSFIL